MEQIAIDAVEKALAGEHITRKEAVALLGFDTFSPEAYHVAYGANVLARQACDGIGLVYAQIGVDTLPCAKDCEWCSFSSELKSNKHGASGDFSYEDCIVDIDQIVLYAKTYDEAGAHLISLMATATLPFERFLEMAQAVRANVSDDMPIIANIGDFTLEQAHALKAAGVQGIYHANRLGEGIVTKIDPQTRIDTMRNAKQAGLAIMNAVEPVHSQSDPAEIVEKMLEAASFKPFCSGIGTLTPVPGSQMENVPTISRARAFYYGCVYRLLVGSEMIPFGAGATNAQWTDAGTNPRGRDLSTDPDYLKRDVKRIVKNLKRQEWKVPSRPSADVYFEIF